ncbi:MAG: UDP-N-acetylmuramoyl-L-alanine--D-glutamate ligase, partial [Gaiellales bacterium]
RLQEVGTVDGVIYVNDSKATNVDAAVRALTAYEAGIHLILGGSGKGFSFDRLASAATGGKVRQVLLIGAAAAAIAASFERAGRETVTAGDLEEAVRLAREGAAPGDIVLLSPACASFDQYHDYEERGEHFISIVRRLEKERD